MTEFRIIPYVFEGEHLFRRMDRNGEPWFIAGDACRHIGVRNVSDAVARLDESGSTEPAAMN